MVETFVDSDDNKLKRLRDFPKRLIFNCEIYIQTDELSNLISLRSLSSVLIHMGF